MAQKSKRLNGANPFQSAVDSIEQEFQRWQKEFQTRSKSLEKQLEKSRRQFETQGRKQIKRFNAEVRKNPYVKRAETLRKNARREFESRMEDLLSAFQIASKGEIERVDRKLRTLAKKLAEFEKAAGSRTTRQSAADQSARV